MPACRFLRAVVVASAALLLLAILMETIAQTTSFQITVNVLAILAALSSPALMLLAFALALLPARLTHLDHCQH
jgi:hypothetical protein